MFRQSLIAGKLRGMQVVKPPLKLYFDARLRFNAEKQIQIVFEKYEEETFSMVKEGQVLDNQTPISESPKLQELHSAALAANPTFLVKALTWANGGIDAVKDMTKNRPEFRKKLNSSFDVYEDLVESGNAKWLTDEQLTNYTVKYNKYFPQIVKNNIDNNRFVSLDNERWKYFEQNFIFFISTIARLTGGEIEIFAIDGQIIFQNK